MRSKKAFIQTYIGLLSSLLLCYLSIHTSDHGGKTWVTGECKWLSSQSIGHVIYCSLRVRCESLADATTAAIDIWSHHLKVTMQAILLSPNSDAISACNKIIRCSLKIRITSIEWQAICSSALSSFRPDYVYMRHALELQTSGYSPFIRCETTL